MSRRAAVGSASSALPPSLAEHTAVQIKALKQNILTEHFNFAPESFAKQGMDVVNVAMYAATEVLETSLLDRLAQQDAGAEGTIVLDEEAIQAGIYKLETLLEAAIDKHFDLFEIYVLRNTFAIKTEIIPYLTLTHQKDVKSDLIDADEEALESYEEERRLYEEELAKERELGCVKEFMSRKVEGLRRKAEEIGFLGNGTVSISDRVTTLSTQLPLLSSEISSLLSTPSTPLPTTQATSSTTKNPWGESRAAYINWTSSNKIDSLPPAKVLSGSSASETSADRGIAPELAAKGSSSDAIELLKKLQG